MEGTTGLENFFDSPSAATADRPSGDSPLLSVANVTPRGLVLFSRRNIEVGSQLRMGLHVRLKHRGNSASRSHFVDVEGFVVGSTARTDRGRTMFEITLLFNGISAEEHRLLTSVPRSAIEARASRGISDYEAFLLGEETRSVVGLN